MSSPPTPLVLMTAYAVRGLDINTSYTIYNLLNEQKKKGVAVIYVGEDLDVLLELCDRILVLCGGQVNGIVDGRNTTKEEVGLLMTRFDKGGRRRHEHSVKYPPGAAAPHRQARRHRLPQKHGPSALSRCCCALVVERHLHLRRHQAEPLRRCTSAIV